MFTGRDLAPADKLIDLAKLHPADIGQVGMDHYIGKLDRLLDKLPLHGLDTAEDVIQHVKAFAHRIIGIDLLGAGGDIHGDYLIGALA